MPGQAPEPRHRATLKLLTVNVHKGFTLFNRRFILHELRTALRDARPDIVFLQEVIGSHHRHARRLASWPATSQYEFLADSLWSDFAYGRNAVYPDGDHGNAVLSRWPIVQHQNHDVSVGSHESRGMLHCVVRHPELDEDLHAVCVHLGLRESHRRVQLGRLCGLVQDIGQAAPVLVAGDFNDWRRRAGQLLAHCSMRDVFRSTLGSEPRTFPAQWPLLALDRVYVRNVAGARPVALASRVWRQLSDHAPLAAEVQL
ncbi:endonuclease/exonuclease/phosphatase family protein [Bordetella petrii]|uniref:endonuclease/exonuclease/phosphatase family protein n=1 Tax=Bordetella petrii TaxID=94624 RepID=UPI001E4F054C|nr:endonuclease/exonuclease/phosphatase family protein [Bordetella petrii]MCD0504134.1 endonuclease/exonuclease/phosphatase family protein [Bordetella petrii]